MPIRKKYLSEQGKEATTERSKRGVEKERLGLDLSNGMSVTCGVKQRYSV